MPKLSSEEQLKQLLRRHFTFELKNRLIIADNSPLSSKKAYVFTKTLITSDPNIAKQIELVSSLILRAKLPKATFTYLINNLAKIPILSVMMDRIFKQVNAQFINDERPCLNDDLPSEKADAYRSNILGYIEEAFGEIDMREYATHERNVRRMDSLARLLTLSSSLSVCSAVTFYQGKLLIAANLGKESVRDEVINALKNRFKIICEFIAEVRDMKTTEVPEVAEKFYSRLVAEGRSNFQKDTITQAMCKFAHAVYKDTETLSDNFRSLFTHFNEGNYLIILPALSPSNAPRLSISHLDKLYDYVIEEQPFCESVKFLHAEQLIAWYIFKINATSQETLDLLKKDAFKLPLGISKLSCKTCQENLLTLPLEMRGTHQQSYPEVIGLFTQSIEPIDPEQQFKSAVIFADRSHPSTIFDSNSESSITSFSKRIPSFGSLSQPSSETYSHAKPSRSHPFFSSQPSTQEEKVVTLSVWADDKFNRLGNRKTLRYSDKMIPRLVNFSEASITSFCGSSNGSLSQPPFETYSRIKSSRSDLFFSSPCTQKEKENVAAHSECLDDGFNSLESQNTSKI